MAAGEEVRDAAEVVVGAGVTGVSDMQSILDHIIAEEHLEQGISFYRLVSEILEFAGDHDNFESHFAALKSKDRRNMLRRLLVLAVNQFFTGEQREEYSEIASNLFRESTTVGNVSLLVLQLMQIAQASSKGRRIPGSEKHAFVKRAISTILMFTDLKDAERDLIMSGVDGTIHMAGQIKNGALESHWKRAQAMAESALDLVDDATGGKASKCLPCF